MHELEEALKARGERPQSPELDDLRLHVEQDQDEICSLKHQIMDKDTRVCGGGAECEGVRVCSEGGIVLVMLGKVFSAFIPLVFVGEC